MANRTALAIMRLQPLHSGHLWIINQMIAECENVIIGIGSTNAPKDIYNPWSFEDRKQMLRNVYSDRIKIIPVADLGTDSTTTDWCEYVLSKIKKLGLPDPTDYFTGSLADSVWYSKHFLTQEEFTYQLNIWEKELKYNPNSNGPTENKLHIRERNNNPFPAATDLRTFLKLGSDKWKDWTPRVNHSLIQDKFPKEFITG